MLGFAHSPVGPLTNHLEDLVVVTRVVVDYADLIELGLKVHLN